MKKRFWVLISVVILVAGEAILYSQQSYKESML